MASVNDRRAQETQKAFRLEFLSAYEEAPKSLNKSLNTVEALDMLEGFYLNLSESYADNYHCFAQE